MSAKQCALSTPGMGGEEGINYSDGYSRGSVRKKELHTMEMGRKLTNFSTIRNY